MAMTPRPLALTFVLALATAPIFAHELPASDHPAWVHFHIKGHVRTRGGQAIGDANVFYAFGLGSDAPKVGRFQIAACKLEIPPVRTASDGSYDLIVYHESPSCERQIKSTLSLNLVATKDGFVIERPRGL